MSYGLIGLKDRFEGQALGALSQVSNEQERDEDLRQQTKSAESAQRTSSVVSGAGMGMMMGMQAGSVGGPVGAIAGAAIGYLASELF